MKDILEFKGEHSWLSNFDTTPFKSAVGLEIKSVEHLYQACKANSEAEFMEIINAATPGEAKKLGRKVQLRETWDAEKDFFMASCLTLKFSQNRNLVQKLHDTGDAQLVEGNWWGDTYWGVCNGKGENKLGEMLMRIRMFIQYMGVDEWINAVLSDEPMKFQPQGTVH